MPAFPPQKKSKGKLLWGGDDFAKWKSGSRKKFESEERSVSFFKNQARPREHYQRRKGRLALEGQEWQVFLDDKLSVEGGAGWGAKWTKLKKAPGGRQWERNARQEGNAGLGDHGSLTKSKERGD